MSIPKQPHQQMIHLMYLVLTALLAMNIQAEILDVFYLVKEGIAISINSMDEKNSPTLQKKLFPSITKSFIDFLFVFINRCNIFVNMAWWNKKIAKLAVGHTNIGSVCITIDDPGYFSLGHLLLSHFVGDIH